MAQRKVDQNDCPEKDGIKTGRNHADPVQQETRQADPASISDGAATLAGQPAEGGRKSGSLDRVRGSFIGCDVVGAWWAALESRGLIQVQGLGSRDFLQGLLTNDLRGHLTCFSALLTPQGRFVADFFVVQVQPDLIFLDCDLALRPRVIEILTRLGVFHQVQVALGPESLCVMAAAGPYVAGIFQGFLDQPLSLDARQGAEGSRPISEAPLSQSLWQVHPAGYTAPFWVYPDRRHSQMGVRALVSRADLHETPSVMLACVPELVHTAHQRTLGVPEGARDLISGKSIILNYGYHHLGALSWSKGCYMGQELMARTYHRGEIRRQLVRLTRYAPNERSLVQEGLGTGGRLAGQERWAEGANPSRGTPQSPSQAVLEPWAWPPVGSDLFWQGRKVGTLASGLGNEAFACASQDFLDSISVGGLLAQRGLEEGSGLVTLRVEVACPAEALRLEEAGNGPRLIPAQSEAEVPLEDDCVQMDLPVKVTPISFSAS